MRVNVDALMFALLAVFITSFAIMMIYGEVWQIRLATTDTNIEDFDPERTQNLFIVSCICIASGASMLGIFTSRFSQDEKGSDS